MSRRAVALLLLCGALVACRKDAPPPARTPAAPSLPQAGYDADNALNLVNGGAVVHRDGEVHLESSAVHAIDAFPESPWTSPPGTPDARLIYSMLAPTRLQRVGVSTAAVADVPESVAFDASMDGETWTELGTLKVRKTHERQLLDVTPVVAQYVRVRPIDPKKHYYLHLNGIHAIGEEVAQPATPPFAGCWTINGSRAWIEENGARVTGVIATDPPTFFDGGTDGRLASMMWLRGATWGTVALTRSPDGQHLSALSFFGEADRHIGEGWFGERCTGALTAAGVAAGPAALLARAGRYSLHGLAFDEKGRLDEAKSASTLDTLAALIASSSQPLRVVAHELREDDPEQNRRHTAARLRALRAALEKRGVNLARIDFVSAGNDVGEIVVRSSLQRSLLSRVDLVSGT